MIRILSTILFLHLVSLLPAQQLERVYQGGSTIVVDQQSCSSPAACDDLDPTTYDLCLAGQCAHSSMSGMIPGSHALNMNLHGNGSLWYTTLGGLVQYDGTTAKYITPQNTAWPNKWSLSQVIDPLVAPNGDLWVAGSENSNGHEPAIGHWDGSQFDSFTNQAGFLANGGILDMEISSNGDLTVLHDNGLMSQYDGANWTTIDLSQFTALSNFNARSIDYDSADELWLGGKDNNQTVALAHFDGSVWTVLQGNYTLFGFGIELFIDSNDNKWLYSISNGLIRYNTTWSIYTYANGNMASGNINEVAEGQNGELWLAMGSGGLAKFNPSTATAVAYTYLNSSNPLHSIVSVAANPSSNIVYAGNGYGREAEVMTYDGANFNVLPNAVGPNYERSEAFLDFENDGNIWYQGRSNKEIAYYDGNNWISLPNLGVQITDLLVDQNGLVWLTIPTNVGNYIFTYNGGAAYTQHTLPHGANALGEMALDANDHLWVNYYDGISEFDGTNWTPYSNTMGNFPSPSQIYHVSADANGIIWVWCQSGEVYSYDGSNWNLILSTPSSWYAGILSGNQGELWFASIASLKKYDNGSITSYDNSNSPWASVRIGRIALSPSGEFWGITTTDRLIHINGQNFPSYDLDSLGFQTDTSSYLTFAPNGDLWISNRSGVAQFSMQTAVDTVWPGDANDDLVANNFDILALGQAFGSSGPARPNASLNWQAEAVPSWSNNLPNGANYAHTDTDGSGTVDLDDTLAVNLNYGLTHNKGTDFAMSGATPLLIIPDLSSYLPGDTVEAPIILGLDTLLADSVYGIAFTISYDPMLIDSGSFEVDYTTSWLGDKNLDMITLARDDYPNAQADLALSRTDQIERSGFGQIAKVRVVMIDDISGKNLLRDTLRLEISNVRLIRLDGTDIPYDTEVALVEVTQAVTAISDLALDLWQVFPNPAQDQIIIKAKRSAERQTRLTLYNLQGQIVFERSIAIGEQSIDLPALPNALYLLQLQNDAGIYRQKLQIQN